MLLSEVVFDAFYMVEDFGTLFPETATRFLAINGQRRSIIDMRPGEVQRWRLVGSQYQNNMLLELDKHRLNVIACDGIQLGSLQEMKQLLMAPGQRADVLVQAGGPGTYELNAMPYDQGHDSPAGPLARVIVAGEPLPMKLPSALPKPPLETISDGEITGRRTLVFGATEPQNNVAGHWQEYAFTVDGKVFDPARIDQRVRLGAVEEWTIRNTHQHDDHMFHIHTNPFQVVEIGGQPQADRMWRDTVVVPRPAKGGSTVIRWTRDRRLSRAAARPRCRAISDRPAVDRRSRRPGTGWCGCGTYGRRAGGCCGSSIPRPPPASPAGRCARDRRPCRRRRRQFLPVTGDVVLRLGGPEDQRAPAVIRCR